MKYLLVLLLGLVGMCVHAQDVVHSGKTISFGISYGGLNEELTDRITHRERNYITHIGYGLTDRLMAVGQLNIIRSNFESDPQNLTTTLVGFGLLQYDFVPNSKHRLFLESGVGFGEYCTCGELLPRQESGITYGSFGVGTHLRLWRGISLELAFTHNLPLGAIEDRHGYNIGSIGLHFNRVVRLGR
jgi:hypothetical protein